MKSRKVVRRKAPWLACILDRRNQILLVRCQVFLPPGVQTVWGGHPHRLSFLLLVWACPWNSENQVGSQEASSETQGYPHTMVRLPGFFSSPQRQQAMFNSANSFLRPLEVWGVRLYVERSHRALPLQHATVSELYLVSLCEDHEA